MVEIDTIKIKEIALGLSSSTAGLTKRAFIKDVNLGIEPRIKVFRGFRGVGKTTALLQLMAGSQKAIYFSMDHPVVEEHSLYEVGNQFIKTGYNTLLIDEVHHYPKWKKDTKALYDEFPHVALVVSGSAPLAFEPERRYEIIDVGPLSLKEFAELSGKNVEATESWRNLDKTLAFMADNGWLTEYYEQYLSGGGFPTVFKYREKTNDAIYNSILKSIREDALFFSSIRGEDVRAMERLLLMLATGFLGDFSINSMARHLEITKYKGYELISLLQEMRILRLVRPYGKGVKFVRGEPKLMFYHPNLRSAICNALGVKPDIGALREELAVFSLIRRGWYVNTIKGRKRNPDYIIEKGRERMIIEVGGQTKGAAQLAGFMEKTLVVTDRQLVTLALF